MKRIYFLWAAMLLVFYAATEIQAQDVRKVQFTFFYPVGSSGINSAECRYNFSFNTIYGLNGGINGFELGSVGNIVKGSVNGFQLAGVFNLTTQNSSGVTVSGVMNSCRDMNGLQLTGVGNFVNGNQKGLQIAGVCNITTGNSNGLSISGVSNISRGDAGGAMISGVVNLSGTMKGLQLSTVNITTRNLNGAQIGVVNFAPKGKGFQLGVVNIGKNENDSIFPLGVFNLFKNGYYALGLSTDESLFTRLSYKMGVERLYTIFQFGAGFRNNTQFFSTGAGFGTILNLGGKHKISVEATSMQFYENDFKYIADTYNQINLDYQYQLTSRLALKIGPTINCFIEEKNKNNNNDAVRVPYSIIEATGNKYITSIWIGANAGFVIRL